MNWPYTLFPFIRFTNWKQDSLAARITFLAKAKVSIHTLHELEASQLQVTLTLKDAVLKFPFIRFTNWKQVSLTDIKLGFFDYGFHSYASRIGSKLSSSCFLISFHQRRFHSYASRIGSKTECVNTFCIIFLTFPFIRFANWKQELGLEKMRSLLDLVSIHTLHELEARLALQN